MVLAPDAAIAKALARVHDSDLSPALSSMVFVGPATTSRYNELVERGAATLKRLRNQPVSEDASTRVEGYVDQAVELTQEALGTVASQTRAVGGRAAKLVGGIIDTELYLRRYWRLPWPQ